MKEMEIREEIKELKEKQKKLDLPFFILLAIFAIFLIVDTIIFVKDIVVEKGAILIIFPIIIFLGMAISANMFTGYHRRRKFLEKKLAKSKQLLESLRSCFPDPKPSLDGGI